MIEHRNPLPAGRYWVDVTATTEVRGTDPDVNASLPPRDQMSQWFSVHKSTLRPVSTVDHADAEPPRAWYLFDVLAPTPWVGIGLPSAAGNVKSEADTTNRPDPSPDLLDAIASPLSGLASSAGRALAGGVIVLAAVATLVAVISRRKPTSRR
jgi:hypothetical protein